ncbi:MAG: metal-sulfur cluster assembly factor [Nanoarchaeota archaeon]
MAKKAVKKRVKVSKKLVKKKVKPSRSVKKQVKPSKKPVKKLSTTPKLKGALTKNHVIAVLKQCMDPELGLDIYTLGLIYDIHLIPKGVDISMTFTTPACPYGPYLLEEVKHKVSTQLNLSKVNIDVVFDPPWKPSDEVKMLLGVS